MKKVLCFDLDDTLIDDNYKFELTFCECIKAIINSLETRTPQIDDIFKTAQRIENDTWNTWPKNRLYSPERVANAWVEAYKQIAKGLNLPIRKHTEQLINSLVISNYDPPYFVIPGAIEAITELKRKGYTINVITLGVKEIQRRKLTVSRIIKFVDNIYYESYDKTKPLKNIKRQNNLDDLYMIGNSMRTDINPALSLGIKAIYIPRGNWHRFSAKPTNQKYTQIEDIRELINII